jgi:hypothetical protein
MVTKVQGQRSPDIIFQQNRDKSAHEIYATWSKFQHSQKIRPPSTISPPSFKFLSQPVFGSQSFEKRSSKAKNLIFGTLLLATQLIYGESKKYFWVTIKLININSKHDKNTNKQQNLKKVSIHFNYKAADCF